MGLQFRVQVRALFCESAFKVQQSMQIGNQKRGSCSLRYPWCQEDETHPDLTAVIRKTSDLPYL